MKLKGLIPYALAFVALGSVAFAQQHHGPSSPPEQEMTTDRDGPRRLSISVKLADPEDLKVAEGDRLAVGQLIADRSRERQRLESQSRQLNLTLQRLERSSITPPLPPAAPPPLITPTYLEQDAAISKADSSVQQAEASIEAKRLELDYLSKLPNLDPLVLEHEQANLAELQLEHTAAVREYQFALGKRSTAEYEHSRAISIDTSTRNRDLLSYQNQWAQYEQRLRDRDYQLSQTQLKLDEIQNAIANLAVVRSPYAGRIRRVKWLGQDSSGQLSAEITLMVGGRDRAGDSLTLPGQQRELSGDADGFGYSEQQ